MRVDSMKILAFCLLIAGAFVSYSASLILGKFSKKEFGEKEIAAVKTAGLFIALAGAIIIFAI